MAKGKQFQLEYELRRALKLLKHRRKRKIQLTNRRRREERMRRGSARLLRSQRRRGYHMVTAPNVLSFVRNTPQMVIFINELESSLAARRAVWVVLENVQTIDHCGVVVLLSVMIRFKARGIQFNGDFPEDRDAKTILFDSGFFDRLNRPTIDQDQYKVGQNSGLVTHASKEVDAKLYAKIIEVASKHVWGQSRRCQGVQKVLIELTHNTNNHASLEKRGERHWWLSICNKPGNVVAFSLVDYGVGIFRSLRKKGVGDKFYGFLDRLQKFGDQLLRTDATMLKSILEGELHRTASASYFRGKGLPGIKEALDNNSIKNLCVVTNRVRAYVDKNRYELMDSEFRGTFVSWEMTPEIRNCAQDED